MKTTISKTLTVLAILVLATAIFFAGWMVSHAFSFGSGWMMGGYGGNTNGYAPGGMMGGAGGYGSGGGMMGGAGGYGSGGGMMGGAGGYGSGGGMMGGNTYSNAAPATIDQMMTASQTYIDNSGLTGLEVGEIMIFDNNAYAIVLEKETGLGAFELLMNSGSQIAFPEYGPNMMWNLKYGMMANGGMMGGAGGYGTGGGMMGGSTGGMMGGSNSGNTSQADVPADELPVTKEKAFSIAQAYLDQYLPGTIVAEDSTQFYGYYSMDFEKDGIVAGMLSVNGYNQQVFLHTWHGTFIEESGMTMK